MAVVARRLLERSLPFAIVGAVVAGLFSQTRHYGLLGFDSYPLIVTSRVASLGDFAGNFSEQLMDGRYASGFHRPLLNLTFALDHAVWGLEPFGYQLTGALLLGACALALASLLRRLLGARAWVGRTIGLGVFLLSPLLFEVLPAPPRRPELLCCAFTALALTLQLAPRVLDSSRPSFWPALATLLAIASKETGYVVPALIFVAVALYSERETWGRRLRRAAAAALPPLAAAGLMLLVRLSVLGGLGGHRSFSAAEAISGMPGALRALALELLWPQPVMRLAPLALGLPALLALSLAATALLAPRAPLARRSKGPLEAATLGIVWVASIGSTYAAAGSIGPWYLLLPLAGWALAAGALAQALFSCAADDRRGFRALALATLALLVVLLVWQSSYSPLFRRYDEWQRATAAGDAFLAAARSSLASAAPGTTVRAAPLPSWVPPRSDGPTIRGAAILADYSVQAWADLTLAGRGVRVVHEGAAGQPGAGEILLVLPLSSRP